MAYVKDFVFDNLSRIGNDNCDVSQRNLQNTTHANYMLENFFSQDCNMKRPIDLATSQPNIFFTGSHQVGVGGCNIDANSDLMIGTINTHPKCRISLMERPFLTVPYLGRGSSNPVLESQIQQGEMITNKKSISTVSEHTHLEHRHYPLIPSIANTVTNPANLVEGVAEDGWIRGGLPSRELQKDQDYVNNHSKNQYV
jgi:hypothetical protein